MDCLERTCVAAAAGTDRMLDRRSDQPERAKKGRKGAGDARNDARRREAQAAKDKKKAQQSLEAVRGEAGKAVGKPAGTVQKQGGELKTARARNSRLSKENNKIKKGRQEPRKTPSDGKKGGKREAPRRMPVTKKRVVDRRGCRECDAELGNAGEPDTRTVDTDLGRREATECTVTRRWCPRCRDMTPAPAPGVAPKQRFGNRVLGTPAFLKVPGVPFRNMAVAFCNARAGEKTMREAARRAGDALMPQYEAVHGRILEGDSVNGDETGWRVPGLPYRAWPVRTRSGSTCGRDAA